MAKNKLTLPSVNLDLTLKAGKTKAAIAAATGKETEYIVRVDQLRTLPGFNVRVTETDDYRSDLEKLKQSIRENGFYRNKPLGGFIGKDDGEDVIYVTDGHRRLEAVTEINAEAMSEGEEIEALPVVLKPADSNLADLTIALVQDNSGRALTPYEMGVVVQRLQNMKNDDGEPAMAKGEIARKLSITERYVDDLNVLVGAPAKVRTAVLEGAVSSTLAIQELRKNPKKAEERLMAAVSKAKAAGKTKATKKDLGGVKMQKIKASVSLATGDTMGDVLKALAKQIRDVVPHSSKDDGDALQVDGTISVTMEIPAEGEPDPKPKAKPAKKTAAKPKASTKKAGAKKTGGKKAEVTSDEQGEPVKLPPKVKSDQGADDPDDI